MSRCGNQSHDCHHAYSHAQLHECFLLKSSRLVHVLRAATRRVHRQVRAFGSGQGWLTEKLLYRQSYLAFTNLTHLHPYFTEEEDNEEEDHQGEESSGSREGEALQLDSLKVRRLSNIIYSTPSSVFFKIKYFIDGQFNILYSTRQGLRMVLEL